MVQCTEYNLTLVEITDLLNITEWFSYLYRYLKVLNINTKSVNKIPLNAFPCHTDIIGLIDMYNIIYL